MELFCGTKVMTPTGPMSIYNLGFTKTFEKECFKINFNDNTSLIVPLGSGILSTTKEFYQFNKPILPYKGHRCKKEVETKVYDFNQKCIDPYLIGLLSCIRVKGGYFTSPKLDKLNLENAPIDYYKVKVKNQNYRARIVPQVDYPNILSADIKNMGLDCPLKYRFIPENYIFSDRKSRENLVKGIMDGGGNLKKQGLFLTTCSISLAQDLVFLVRSLGGFARISKLSHKAGLYRVDLKVDFHPFVLTEHLQDKSEPRVKRMLSIEKVGIQPCAEIPTESLIIDNFLEVN